MTLAKASQIHTTEKQLSLEKKETTTERKQRRSCIKSSNSLESGLAYRNRKQQP